MIEKISSQTVGKENIDASPFVSIASVIEFLDTHLPDFPSDFTKRTTKPEELEENFISQELEIFLNRKSRDEVFRFKGQWNYKDSDRKPDFGVIEVEDRNPFGFTEAFFEIEAKILPTGKKDYVQGNLGGIERFKRGHHGQGLPQSAMIGYIQKETCKHWHSKINEWIIDLVINNTDSTICWNLFDLLEKVNDFGKTQKFKSKNTRIVNSNKDSIELHHYLMELI